ncbi:MAG TPA: 50S ribosomal protein L18 [Bacilli bacterium]|nr:50S ribosomal protein L18 [Bacilli bacterium]
MDRNILKQKIRERKKAKVRTKISGTKEIPRCSVFKSLKDVNIELIDDTEGKTIVSLNSSTLNLKGKKKTEEAYEAGKKLAEMAKEKGITNIVFDRNGYIYHGRVAQVAQGLRDGGLIF